MAAEQRGCVSRRDGAASAFDACGSCCSSEDEGTDATAARGGPRATQRFIRPPSPGIITGCIFRAKDGRGPWTLDAQLRTTRTEQGLASGVRPAGGAGSPRPWSVAASPSLLGGSCRSSRWLALWGSSHSACWSQSVSSVTWRGGASVGSGTQVQHLFAPHPPAVQSDRVAGFPGPRPAAVSLGGGHTVSHPARRGRSPPHTEAGHPRTPRSVTPAR